MKYKIYNQDVIEWAEQYSKGKFHALLSDAPYHLTSIVKRFGKKNSAPAQYGTDGVFSRSSRGFMGQEWDGGYIAFRPETWSALGEHLYPGAFGMVFSASRNWHRLAVAIEDAGMVIHPTIFGWLNGQGFPKATNISKQVDKSLGLKPVKGKRRTDGRGKDPLTSEQAKAWQGHRYGLQALKPAVEPIIVFQKPYEGRPLDNIIETGAGALNIDGGRIPTQENLGREIYQTQSWKNTSVAGVGSVDDNWKKGRWPANFILDESVAPALDKQSGIQKGGFVRNRTDGARPFENNGKDTGYHTDEVITEPDGGASRFFFNVQQQIDDADPIYYCSKVSTTERSAGLDERCNHPTMKALELSKYLATLLLPPDAYAPRRIMVPFSGVGSEMVGCALAGWEQIVGIEFDKENGYVEMAHKRMEYWTTK